MILNVKYGLSTDSVYELPLCVDMDECSDLNGGCEHICINTDGSFKCYCRNGYELMADGFQCEGANSMML